MESAKTKAAAVQFNLKLPKSRGSREYFDITIDDVDEPTFIMAQSMIKAGKDVEAVKFVLRELYAGGDKIEEVLDCFHSVHCAMTAIIDLLNPAEVELKKN